MNDYTVEDIVVTLTKEEFYKIGEAILCLDNEGYDVPDSLYDKFQSQPVNTTQRWWETTESETTDQPHGE